MEINNYEKEHNARLRMLAPECTVLLKKNGDFPLPSAGQIALYGSGARLTIKGGTGSGDVNSRYYVTAEQGLREAGFTVTSGKWLDAYDAIRAQAKKAFIAEVTRIARQKKTMPVLEGMGRVMMEPEYQLPLDAQGDTAVYVLARNSGEGNDRKPEAGDVKLTKTEIRDILECSRRYSRFMLVLNVGGVVDLTPVNQVPNILILSQLGVVTGEVLADILLGKANPSGKLTTTWTSWEDYSSIGNFGDPADTYYKEGIYVGYRYFDSIQKPVMYPFGFGLSYTEFQLGTGSASLDGTKVTISVPVTNTGKYPGKEVVQVYVSVPWGKLDQPYQTLAGFSKTRTLNPGETETVSVSFGMETIASYDSETARYVLEQGSYILRVGNSSRNTAACAVVSVRETILVRQLTNIGGKPDFIDWKPEGRKEDSIADIPVLELRADAVAALRWPEPHIASEAARKKAASLSDRDLIRMCLGYYKEGAKGFASVVGNSAPHVAGGAGETTDSVEGVAHLVMADGPAGLRLAQHYTKDKKGIHTLGIALPAGMEDFLGTIPRLLVKLGRRPPKSKQIYDQYCTAIPIGTALAQSWNTDLCESCGDIVGSEMELFHIDLWLAPAFNIHRSILCGRNFEYCSEDPLISGLVSAAITRGVQKHPGKGTTVKHFCCNNQETDRYVSNSHVSERALREIYVRGFEICIRESNPSALMTSYNLLNGIHTSERSDLMRTLLREEWGYDGLIMTDWVIGAMGFQGKYRMAKSAPTIAAGNDLFMPGCEDDYNLAMAALKGENQDFRLTREEAEYCAAHVIDTAWRMKQ